MVSYPLSTGRIKTLPGNERMPKILGYSGLIPFITFSIGSWLPSPYHSYSVTILISYAAIILSFMGAIHWGVAMANKEKTHTRYYLSSIIPALAAWLSLLVPEIFSLFILATGFALLISYDIAVEKSQDFPAWYIPMRIRLTIIVLLCLASTLLSLVTPLP